MIWRAIIGSRVGRAIGAALLAVLAVLGYGAAQRRKGRKDADNANALQEQDDYIETRKRIDQVTRDLDGDDRDWLHERGNK